MNNQDEDDDSAYQCETMYKLKEEKNYKAIIDHVLTACLKCVASTQKYKGQEMLFPREPPPWIEIPEEEKKDPKNWEKYKKRVEPSHAAMSEEQIDEYLEQLECGDEKLVWEIIKFKKVERPAAWIICNAIRKRRKERANLVRKEEDAVRKQKMAEERELERLKKADEKRKSMEKRETQREMTSEYEEKLEEEKRMIMEDDEEEEKEDEQEQQKKKKKESTVFNVKNQMPWAPSVFDILEPDSRSSLSHDIQKRLSAMCQHKMYHGEFQHGSNKREFSDFVKSADGEYDKLAEAAKQWANKQGIHPLNFVKTEDIKVLLNSCNLRKFANEKFSLSNIIFTIETSQSVDITVTSEKNSEIPRVIEVLHEGVADFLEIPQMTKKCELPNFFKTPKEKLLINEDPNIRALLKSSPMVNVAMDATTVCHLMTPNWESRNYGMTIGIDVENIDGKNVVILSKPKASSTINLASLQRKRIKNQIRTKFIKVSEKNQNYDIRRISQIGKREDEAKEFEKVNMSVSSSSVVDSDPLDEILANAQKMEKEYGSAASSSTSGQRKFVETGYRYSIVQFGNAEILIRSRPAFLTTIVEDANQQQLQGVQKMLENRKNVTFEPRVEYLPNGGAMELGPEEYVWNYTKKLIKQSDSHLLFRTHYKQDHILQVDALTMEEKNQSARPKEALAILSQRTMLMEKFVSSLGVLDKGRFLAYQDAGQDLRVVASAPIEDEKAINGELFDLNTETVQNSDAETHYFNGFSPDVMLQWQIVQGRAPRMLLAEDAPMIARLPTKATRDKMLAKQRANKRKRNKKKMWAENAKRPRFDFDDPNADYTRTPHHYNAKRPYHKRKQRGGKRS